MISVNPWSSDLPLKHYRCKLCGDISIVRHYHMARHKEIKVHQRYPYHCFVNDYFEEVEFFLGSWIVKH